MNVKIKPLTYYAQFFWLGFCTVLFVASYHWIVEISRMQRSFFPGGLVNFFFVLSGYFNFSHIILVEKERNQKWNTKT
jgi:peptidoglycan/LPS O-acetylase OafA/YrhL